MGFLIPPVVGGDLLAVRAAGVVEASPAERAGTAPGFPGLRERGAAPSSGDIIPGVGWRGRMLVRTPNQPPDALEMILTSQRCVFRKGKMKKGEIRRKVSRCARRLLCAPKLRAERKPLPKDLILMKSDGFLHPVGLSSRLLPFLESVGSVASCLRSPSGLFCLGDPS